MEKLSTLLGYDIADDVLVAGISADSREIRQNWLFAVMPGSKAHGSQYIAQALDNGANAILSGLDVEKVKKEGVVHVRVENPRLALAQIAGRFYPHQPETIVAVTGTNGKTSTSYFWQQIMAGLGNKAVAIGTTGVIGADVSAPSMTTPDPVNLHRLLDALAEEQVTHLVMEASSHGLDQHRLDAVRLSAAGFTNLTRDHLDYHPDMASYFQAKAGLFTRVLPQNGIAVINADSPEIGKLLKIMQERGIKTISYGKHGTDLVLQETTCSGNGQVLKLQINGQVHDVEIPLIGEFQVENILCALGLALAVTGLDALPRILEILKTIKGAPGRLQLIAGHPRKARCLVDYAHTPDALENVLKSLRPHVKGRLICVFGCGGDRDPGKRPLMGKIANSSADIAIVTDDNPRSEKPETIRAQIMAAAPRAIEIGDRREAIRHAVKLGREGDVIVIAGKGHEHGQIIGSETLPFDDAEEVQKAFHS